MNTAGYQDKFSDTTIDSSSIVLNIDTDSFNELNTKSGGYSIYGITNNSSNKTAYPGYVEFSSATGATLYSNYMTTVQSYGSVSIESVTDTYISAHALHVETGSTTMSFEDNSITLTTGATPDRVVFSNGMILPHNYAIRGVLGSQGSSVANLIYSYDGSVKVNAGSFRADSLYLGSTNDQILFYSIHGQSSYDAIIGPLNDGMIAMGSSDRRWYRVYATSATISTSDSRDKKDIAPIGQSEISLMSVSDSEETNIYLKLFDELEPVQYRMIGGDNKLCFGFLAQDIVSSMENLGIDEDYLDLIHHDTWQDEETGETKDKYGIATDNLVALLVLKIQQLEQRIAELENI